VYVFENDTWTIDANFPQDTINDINCVAFDNNDKNHFYAGAFGDGLMEIKNDKVIAKYTYYNSPIPHRNFATELTNVQVASLYNDINNNLWIGTNDNPTFITVKKNDGTWASLDFSNLVPNIQYLNSNQIVVDSNNMVYVASYGTGVFVYKNDGNFSQPNASNSKLLTNLAGKGGLPSNFPVCLAVDRGGDVWIGTDQGIYVLYNPQSILTQSSGWDAQPIYVQQDGLTQLLLQTDLINSIFVDGANNKWVGTASSGLFCFSPDGQKELYHFTIDNSPLFSNNVITVSVSGKTGEVFIGTDKGMQSFQNTTTEGLTSFEDVYAYPNPVKPGYTGPILIHGMISGASVKIVDAAGNFVYETTAEGGQAIWNGQNFKGARVASGIYMVIYATPDGSQKKLTKILLLN
jgi:ligand-binding sensor domain-containing protein